MTRGVYYEAWVFFLYGKGTRLFYLAEMLDYDGADRGSDDERGGERASARWRPPDCPPLLTRPNRPLPSILLLLRPFRIFPCCFTLLNFSDAFERTSTPVALVREAGTTVIAEIEGI